MFLIVWGAHAAGAWERCGTFFAMSLWIAFCLSEPTHVSNMLVSIHVVLSQDRFILRGVGVRIISKRNSGYPGRTLGVCMRFLVFEHVIMYE